MKINPLVSFNPQNVNLANNAPKLNHNANFSPVILDNKKPITSDIALSFLGYNKDSLSFDNFNQCRKIANICSISELTKNISPDNFLGAGANSLVYSFSDPVLSKWALKVDKEPFSNEKGFVIRKSRDDFYGMNMGQEIARIGDRYRILKKIEGVPHSLLDWSPKINVGEKPSYIESVEFLNSIKKISDFPQSSFDDYAKQLKLLTEKGYKQDSINPNNIIVDYDEKKLHIIDSYKVPHPSHANSRVDLINVLLDFAFFSQFHEALSDEEKDELVNASKIIILKSNLASKKMGIDQDEKTYLTYLTDVDKWFGPAIKDTGGDYRDRYAKLKEILPEVASSKFI